MACHQPYLCLNVASCFYIIYPCSPANSTVGLEKTVYTVLEDEGMVEVCAVVFFPSGSCPIQFPFDIRLVTSDGTAGRIFGK